MLHVRTILPSPPTIYPPIVLIHGAANSAAVWTYWQPMLADAGFASHAIDLRGHGDSAPRDRSNTSMDDYAEDVCTLIAQLSAPPILAGWSMGGLVAMIAAARDSGVRAIIGLAPSTPALTVDESIALRTGEFDASEYGITTRDPDDQPAMPDLDREERIVALSSLCKESRYARDQRAAGVVIEAVPCPLLIVTGTGDVQWPRSRYDGLHLPAEHLNIDGASHWGLVLNRTVLTTLVPRVCEWISASASGS